MKTPTSHLHFLGIGGTLMGSLALLARESGARVTGMDLELYPPMSDQLAAAGIRIDTGWDPQPMRDDEPDLVIVGNANLPRGNPALEYVLDHNLPYTSGAGWLGDEILAGRWTIAVSGTHGKTTTTAMVAWILEHAQLNPGFLIGGVPANFAHSAALGKEPFFVVEADEYDTSYFDRRAKFVHYRPRTLIINNLEHDHADIYPDLAAIQTQFEVLLRSVPAGGLIVVPAGVTAIETVLEAGCWSPVERFCLPGEAPSASGPDQWQATEIAADGTAFTVTLGARAYGRVDWTLMGSHNIANALAAIAAARHAGVPVHHAISALCEFSGVKRRMEIIGNGRGTTVYDDFAHHPTAIRTTLQGLRTAVGEAEIIAVIEPRSHTMSLGSLRDALTDSTAAADHALWLRSDRLRWDTAALENTSTPTQVLGSSDEILEALRNLPAAGARPRHVVLMSNGAFDGIHPQVVAALCGERQTEGSTS